MAALLLSLAGCDGSEGTLVVRHDEAAAGGSASVASKPFVPASDTRWLARLDGAIDPTQAAELYYLDADQQAPGELQALHAQGRRYLCYLSAGSLESFRPDAEAFPGSAVGNVLTDFPNEHWLDVRDLTVRKLMAQRVQTLAELGCDGVPPSSLAVQAADTGFDLTLEDALDYARWLAERIHGAGMSVGLTGPAELTSELWPTFDFALAIGCVGGTQCREYGVFEKRAKTVLHLELADDAAAPGLCKSAQALGFDALICDPALSGHCVACRDIL